MLFDRLKENVAERARGSHPAVVTDELTTSYDELFSRAELLAARLGEAGVVPGNIVLAYLDNGPAFLVGLLAAARLGFTFAALDVGLTDSEIANILALTQSDLVLCDEAERLRCAAFSKNFVTLLPSGTVGDVRVTSTPPPTVSPDIGCLQFSSGTTAASKGILLSHEALFFRAEYVRQALGLTQDDRTLCTLPLSHTHGAECLALPTLLAGATLYLKSPKFAFPLYILQEIERNAITFFSTIPQFYDFAVKLGALDSPDIRSLRLPFCGSAALAKTTAEAFFAKYGVHIKQGYGLVELSVICMNMHDGPNVVYDSVGKPIDGVEWKIVEGGSTGELAVRSKAMFSGYIHSPEATREKVHDGWLHTGDLVTIGADGLFRIVGRKEDFIKVSGFKVYAAEVEAAIIGIDWVKECAVTSERDATGAERIVAHVVPADWSRTEAAMEASLITHLRTVLSDYKVPKRCVAWKEFPKSPLGKILKSKIRTTGEDTP